MSDGRSSETDSNRRTIADAFDAWQRGAGPITDVFAPGMTWRIEGHSAAAGEYQNTKQSSTASGNACSRRRQRRDRSTIARVDD